MVQHEIHHQSKMFMDRLDGRPIAPVRVYVTEMNDGETIVGRIWEERKKMNRAERILQILIHELFQNRKRLFPGALFAKACPS